jgi:hypothetical protein
MDLLPPPEPALIDRIPSPEGNAKLLENFCFPYYCQLLNPLSFSFRVASSHSSMSSAISKNDNSYFTIDFLDVPIV